MELMDKLWNAAKENKQRIVLPEGDATYDGDIIKW